MVFMAPIMDGCSFSRPCESGNSIQKSHLVATDTTICNSNVFDGGSEFWGRWILADGRIVTANPCTGLLFGFFLLSCVFLSKGSSSSSMVDGVDRAVSMFGFSVSLALLFPEMLLESIPSYAWLGTSVLQAAYAWLMSFGLMGLFNWIASRERRWIRYMSDASYWIYLWHFPLVVLAQMFLIHIPLNPHLKFFLLCTTVLAILLVIYEVGVRYTIIGTTLNGRRMRPNHRPATQ